MRFGLLAVIAVLLWGCASSEVARLQPAASAPASHTDEAGLILQMQRYEQELANSPQRLRDPALNAYLRELTCKVAGDYCGEIRIYLLRQPYFNAAMAPNGMLVIWTGLLLRIEDEAQLAAVIGHEVGHYAARHTLARWRKLKSASSLATALQILGGGLVGAAASLGAYGSLFAFSRDQEREADDYGLERMRALGYDDARIGALWAAIWEEDKVKDRELLSAIFASHPASLERRDRLIRASNAAGGRRDAERYRALIEPLRAAWLEDEIGRRHYSQTEVLLGRLATLPYPRGESDYFLAEMYRRRAHDGDLSRAEQAYRSALNAPDAPVAAWRGLGLVLRQQQRDREAAQVFARYLDSAPEAPDRAMIESWLK